MITRSTLALSVLSAGAIPLSIAEYLRVQDVPICQPQIVEYIYPRPSIDGRTEAQRRAYASDALRHDPVVLRIMQTGWNYKRKKP